MLHSNKRYGTPDRRGGRKNQPRPRDPEHHTHVMVAWGSDPRYTHCTQPGCYYAEVNGRPATGQKQRSREYEQQEMFSESFA